jgi:hypothetical protein
LALAGVGELPEWVLALEMAAEWGVPPWVVEKRASLEWVERWAAYRSERNKARQKPTPKGASGGRRRLL